MEQESTKVEVSNIELSVCMKRDGSGAPYGFSALPVKITQIDDDYACVTVDLSDTFIDADRNAPFCFKLSTRIYEYEHQQMVVRLIQQQPDCFLIDERIINDGFPSEVNDNLLTPENSLYLNTQLIKCRVRGGDRLENWNFETRNLRLGNKVQNEPQIYDVVVYKSTEDEAQRFGTNIDICPHKCLIYSENWSKSKYKSEDVPKKRVRIDRDEVEGDWEVKNGFYTTAKENPLAAFRITILGGHSDLNRNARRKRYGRHSMPNNATASNIQSSGEADEYTFDTAHGDSPSTSRSQSSANLDQLPDETTGPFQLIKIATDKFAEKIKKQEEGLEEARKKDEIQANEIKDLRIQLQKQTRGRGSHEAELARLQKEKEESENNYKLEIEQLRLQNDQLQGRNDFLKRDNQRYAEDIERYGVTQIQHERSEAELRKEIDRLKGETRRLKQSPVRHK